MTSIFDKIEIRLFLRICKKKLTIFQTWHQLFFSLCHSTICRATPRSTATSKMPFELLPAAISFRISNSSSSFDFASVEAWPRSPSRNEDLVTGCRSIGSISGFRFARFFDFFFFRSESEIRPFDPKDSHWSAGAMLTKISVK